MNNTKGLAEIIGIILGDGHLHKKSNKITIVGSLEDFYYYKFHVIPLIRSIFVCNPKIRKRNDKNAYYIDFNSKENFAKIYFWKRFGYYRPKSSLTARLEALNLNITQ
ncbi:hypothetical protein COV16_03080 [Candidatus Woesearchaeota archaeon CG10_big_fil_rev_8_21_14_0_10_34_8]|nr:MAG: hypothetical protein COV16_03080 [Candidatus Woesearchaeota archaeon CG10_big_fil_rev_8_21_14_0_10_34_8]